MFNKKTPLYECSIYKTTKNKDPKYSNITFLKKGLGYYSDDQFYEFITDNHYDVVENVKREPVKRDEIVVSDIKEANIKIDFKKISLRELTNIIESYKQRYRRQQEFLQAGLMATDDLNEEKKVVDNSLRLKRK